MLSSWPKSGPTPNKGGADGRRCAPPLIAKPFGGRRFLLVDGSFDSAKKVENQED